MKKLKTTSLRLQDEEDQKLFLTSATVGQNTDDNDNELEDSEDEEVEGDENAHTALLSDLSKLSKKKKGLARRDVRTSVGRGAAAMDTEDIMKRLGSSMLKKSARKMRTVSAPLEKVVERRIKRAAGYDKVSMEVSKWQTIVHNRRCNDQLTFPLEKVDLRVTTIAKEEKPKLRTSLEKEVYGLLQGAHLLEKKNKETEEEKLQKQAMSLQELRERSREMWRQRELRRHLERKAWMQNKSKSRKYHQILRRERLRKQKAEMEQLQKTDPEAALEKLEEIELARVQERMSLRHKTSKWAHALSFRATKDKNAMAALKENMRLHRELTAKTAKTEDSDEEEDKEKDDDYEVMGETGTVDPSNPWTSTLDRGKAAGSEISGQEDDEDVSFTRFKNFWEEVNRRKLVEKEAQAVADQRQKELSQERAKEEGTRVTKDKEELSEVDEVEPKEKEEEEQEENESECDNHDMDFHEEEKEKEEMNCVDGSIKGEKDEGNSSVTNEEEIEVAENNSNKDVTENDSKSNDEAVQNVEDEHSKIAKDTQKTENIEVDEKELENSIDNMFNQAEVRMQKKLKRKLKMMGIKTNDEKWTKVKRRKKSKKSKTATTNQQLPPEEFDFTCKDAEDKIDENLERVKTVDDIDRLKSDDISDNTVDKAVKTLKRGKTSDKKGSELSKISNSTGKKDKKTEVNPDKFIKVDAKKLLTAMPDVVNKGEEGLDDDEEDAEDPEDFIREAFADDYLVDEFQSAKEASDEKKQLKETSFFLPGWGCWGGPDIEVSKRKLRKFRVRPEKRPPSKYGAVGNVIYNEEADVHRNLRKAMVKELPYQFNSVKDFEASVRAPIGRMFVPENVHKKLTAPPVVTKMGAVIKPMTEKELLRHKHRIHSQYEKHKKIVKKGSQRSGNRIRNTKNGDKRKARST